jgi:gamma-glutamyltranspeptidase/glutathione hydrolase
MTMRPEIVGRHGIVAAGVNPKTGTLRGGADPRRERYIFGW